MSKQFQRTQRTRQRGWICADCGVLNDPQARICRECQAPRLVEVSQKRRPFSHTRRNILIAGAVIAGSGLGAFTWKEVQDWRHSQPVLSVLLDERMAVDLADPLAWSPDGKQLVCAISLDTTTQNQLMLLDSASGKSLWTRDYQGYWLQALAWSQGGRWLALARRSYGQRIAHDFALTLQIWQTQDWTLLKEYPLSTDEHSMISNLVWAPDETRLGITLVPESPSQSSVASIQIWDALRGEVVRELRPISSASEMFLSWAPHGDMCATGGQEGALTLWDAGNGTSLFSRAPDSPPAYTGATGQVPLLTSNPAAAMSPDWSRAAIYTNDRGQLSIQVWDMHARRPLFRCQQVSGQQGDLTWSPDGKYLAASGTDNGDMVHLWDAGSGALLFTYHPLTLPQNLTWSPDSRSLALIAYSQPSFFRAPPHKSVLQIFAVG
jgi:WD40 repeat protein/ribosomal protein L40E